MIKTSVRCNRGSSSLTVVLTFSLCSGFLSLYQWVKARKLEVVQNRAYSSIEGFYASEIAANVAFFKHTSGNKEATDYYIPLAVENDISLLVPENSSPGMQSLTLAETIQLDSGTGIFRRYNGSNLRHGVFIDPANSRKIYSGLNELSRRQYVTRLSDGT